VNAVARRIYGGDPWVGELLCVADIILVRLGSGKCDTDSWVGGGPYMVNAVLKSGFFMFFMIEYLPNSHAVFYTM
jgi:hypothetical protein